ncbi:hypothetical protein CABS03_12390 [Colletotrichum abscissum]|uniref:Secreted protein n=2 Tax=Colletotrichum acutatum species complex TaxID=2707335 RepID=A0A9P9XSE4_9PEZI|nr:hypothetical protein CABS02_00557 [Colletotrichum abscissum]
MTMSVWMRLVGWGLTVVPRLVRCRNRAGAGLGRAWSPGGSGLRLGRVAWSQTDSQRRRKRSNFEFKTTDSYFGMASSL